MKNIAIAALVTAAGLALIGCNLTPPGQPEQSEPPVAKRGTAEYLGGREKETAMERVKEVTDKYVARTEECAKLEKEKSKLLEENHKLVAKVAAAEKELARVKTELADADALLVQLTADLKQWKAEVLGVRKEINDAHAIIIQRLCEVIRLEGGEVPDDTGGKSVVKTGTPEKGKTDGGANG